MKSWNIAIFSFLLSAGIAAQEQVAVRLNDKGLLKIMEMGLRYNTATKENRTFVIPKNIYNFKIPKSQLLSNPIVKVANEISDLNLNKDLDFYLNTSDIKLTGEVDAKSLKTSIFNSSDNGFDMRISLSLPKVEVRGAKLSLCEDRQKHSVQCGSGLKASLSQVHIKTRNRPVTITAVLRLRTVGMSASLKVLSVNSNLEGAAAPQLDVSFNSIEVPRIAIVINGQETELDTSKLKSEILQRKSLLGAKLLSFAADFIASDVAEMVNVYLINKQVSTSWEVYRKSVPVKFNEFLTNPDRHFIHSSYVRPPVKAAVDPIKDLWAQIPEIIHNAQIALTLKKITTPLNRDVELSGLVNFVLNNQRLNVRNTLGNSTRSLPKLNLTPYRNNDINLAISEPLINGTLDLVNTTGIFQDLLEASVDVKGISIRNIKMHFNTQNRAAVIVNTSIDLKKLESSGVSQWIKNWIASFLERNNNNAVIYFPIEIEVIPYFKKLADGSMGINIYVSSPFRSNGLINTFGYSTNVAKMTDTVRKAVMDELKKSLEKYTDKNYEINIDKFLNQAGVIFMPKMIAIDQSAYLLLGLDIIDIKFNSQNPNRR